MPKRIHHNPENKHGLAFDLKRLLDVRGITKPHQFLKKAGISPNVATNLLQGYAGGLKWEQIEQLCVALNCGPSHLFRWMGDGSDLPENHELRKLVKPDKVPNVLEKLQSLSPEEAEKLIGG
jgi:DNA-binding Xre family transcriptional regulator